MESWLVWWKSNLPWKRMGGMGYGMLTDWLMAHQGEVTPGKRTSLQVVTCSFSTPRLSPQVSGAYSHPLLPSLLSPSSMASPSPSRPSVSFLSLPSLSFKTHPWEPSWTSQKGDADFQQAPSVKWEIRLMRNLFKWEIPSQTLILTPSLLFLVWIRDVSQELSDPWGLSFSLRYCRKSSACSQGAAGQTCPRISLWRSCGHSTELRIARHWMSLDHVLHTGPTASGVPSWMWQPPPGQGRIPGKTRWEWLCSGCVGVCLQKEAWSQPPEQKPPLPSHYRWGIGSCGNTGLGAKAHGRYLTSCLSQGTQSP